MSWSPLFVSLRHHLWIPYPLTFDPCLMMPPAVRAAGVPVVVAPPPPYHESFIVTLRLLLRCLVMNSWRSVVDRIPRIASNFLRLIDIFNREIGGSVSLICLNNAPSWVLVAFRVTLNVYCFLYLFDFISRPNLRLRPCKLSIPNCRIFWFSQSWNWKP